MFTYDTEIAADEGDRLKVTLQGLRYDYAYATAFLKIRYSETDPGNWDSVWTVEGWSTFDSYMFGTRSFEVALDMNGTYCIDIYFDSWHWEYNLTMWINDEEVGQHHGYVGTSGMSSHRHYFVNVSDTGHTGFGYNSMIDVPEGTEIYMNVTSLDFPRDYYQSYITLRDGDGSVVRSRIFKDVWEVDPSLEISARIDNGTWSATVSAEDWSWRYIVTFTLVRPDNTRDVHTHEGVTGSQFGARYYYFNTTGTEGLGNGDTIEALEDTMIRIELISERFGTDYSWYDGHFYLYDEVGGTMINLNEDVSEWGTRVFRYYLDEAGTWRVRMTYDHWYWDYKVNIYVVDPYDNEELVYTDSTTVGSWAGERNYYIEVKESSDIEEWSPRRQPNFIALLYGTNALWAGEQGVNLSEGNYLNQSWFINSSEINATGKLFVLSSLLNEHNQTIAQNVTQLYITNSSVYLTMEMDQRSYKPGQTISITSELFNEGNQSENVTVRVYDGDVKIYEKTMELDAGNSFVFDAETTATTSTVITGEVIINPPGGGSSTGDLEAQNSTISESVTVLEPSIDAFANAPAEVGLAEFNVSVTIENTGTVTTDLEVTIAGKDPHVISIPVGGSTLVEEALSITSDTWVAIEITGDVEETIMEFIEMVETNDVEVDVLEIYGEGTCVVDLSVENTGKIDSTFTIVMDIRRSGENATLDEQNTEIFVTEGTTYEGEVVWDLTQGVYLMGYSSPFGSGSIPIIVAKEDQADMDLIVTPLDNGSLMVEVYVENVGSNAIVGSLDIETEFYSESADLTLELWESDWWYFWIDISSVEAIQYNMTADVVLDGNSISNISTTYDIPAAIFDADILTKLVATLGEDWLLQVRVLNVGSIGGDVEVEISIPGIFLDVNQSYLDPDEEITMEYLVDIPDDLEARNYTMYYIINGVQKETNLLVRGIKFDVISSLDHDVYAIGEEALFKIKVINTTDPEVIPDNSSMYIRLTFNDYEYVEYFNLTDEYMTSFDLPIDFVGQKKIFYGVHLISGRALYLSSVYVNVKTSLLTIYTDKQIYEPGEVMTITVDSNRTGDLNITTPDDLWFDHYLDGNTTFEYTIPERASGTYYIRYYFENKTSTISFAIDGLYAQVDDITLNKKVFNTSDVMEFEVTIDSRNEFEGLFNVWLRDPEGEAFDTISMEVYYYEDENHLTFDHNLTTEVSGIYSLSYAIFAFNETGAPIRLDQGLEGFDVDGALIMGFETDASTYMIDDTVTITVITVGTDDATLTVYVDDAMVDEVHLTDPEHTTHTFEVDADVRGDHVVDVTLNSTRLVEVQAEYFVMDHIPTLTMASFTPIQGDTNDIYSFNVTLTDEDDDPVENMTLVLNGEHHYKTPGATGTANGVVYSWEFNDLDAGNYGYWFYASDGMTTVWTSNMTGPVVKGLTPPELFNISVSAKKGYTDTDLTFSVQYKDSDGDAPDHVSLFVGGGEYALSREEAGISFKKDNTYSVEINLPVGEHSYYFQASDGITEVRTGNDTITISNRIREYDNDGIYLKSSFSGYGDIGIERVDRPGYLPFNFKDVGIFINLSQPGTMDMDWSYFEFTYNESMTPDNMNESDMVIFYWNGTHWVAPENQGLDLDNNVAWANVTHFTVFAPLFPGANNAPEVTKAGVSPLSGTPYTEFKFSLTYTDIDGNAPLTVQVIIDGTKYNMTWESGDNMTGAVYKYTTKLALGTHTYSFTVDDGYDQGKVDKAGGSIKVAKKAKPDDDDEKSNMWIIVLGVVMLLIIVLLYRHKQQEKKKAAAAAAAAKKKKAAKKKPAFKRRKAKWCEKCDKEIEDKKAEKCPDCEGELIDKVIKEPIEEEPKVRKAKWCEKCDKEITDAGAEKCPDCEGEITEKEIEEAPEPDEAEKGEPKEGEEKAKGEEKEAEDKEADAKEEEKPSDEKEAAATEEPKAEDAPEEPKPEDAPEEPKADEAGPDADETTPEAPKEEAPSEEPPKDEPPKDETEAKMDELNKMLEEMKNG